MAHEYTVQTSQGEKTFQTAHHHTGFGSIEEFLEKHKGVIGLAQTASVIGVSLWLGRGKTGMKLK